MASRPKHAIGAVSLLVWVSCLLPGVGADSPPQPSARQQLEQMSDAEKAEFLRKRNRFYELPDAEQKQLGQLSAALHARPDAERLMHVLQRYSEWLKTLSPGEKAQVLSLPPDQRIAKIREIQQAREAQRFRMMVDGRLSPDDMQVIIKWIDEYAVAHETELLQQFPAGWQLPEDSTPERKRRILGFALMRSPAFNPTAADEKRLMGSMSREAQQFLAKLDSDEERARVLRTWVQAALFSRMRPPVGREELQKFVNEKLDDRQREYLESLSPEAMVHELQRLYYRDLSRREPRRWPGRGMGPGPPSSNPGGPFRPDRRPRDNPPDQPKGTAPPTRQPSEKG